MNNDIGDELGDAERGRLAIALKSLPANLQFLREPIVAIAEQDQDLLGSGEADTSSLDEALVDQLRADFDLSVKSIVQQFKKWSRNAGATGNEAWCGTIHFVTAYLKSAEWLTIEELMTPRPPPPKLGLFKITLDIPENAKTKWLAGGVQIKLRGVEILVIEEVLRKTDDQISRLDPVAPDMKIVIEKDLKIGGAVANRWTLKNLATGRYVYSQYLLRFPELQIEAVIFTPRQAAIDLEVCETILASIQPVLQGH